MNYKEQLQLDILIATSAYKITKLERKFAELIVKYQLWPELAVREYRFHSKRLWRGDFAWPSARVICEVDGGIHRGGWHNRADGILADCEKYLYATIGGWQMVRWPGPWTDEPEPWVDMLRIIIDRGLGNHLQDAEN